MFQWFLFQPQNTARLVESSVVNGVIYCKVERDPLTQVGNQIFDLVNNKYYLLLASGTGLKGTFGNV